MKRHRVGRLIPSRPIKHFLYWPLVITGLTVLYFAEIVVTVRPAKEAFGAWMTSVFGE
jgi:hypothetical protein